MKTKIPVIKVNGFDLLYSTSQARKDPDRFLVKKGSKQIYDTEYLYQAIRHALDGKKATEVQKKRFKEVMQQYDPRNIKCPCSAPENKGFFNKLFGK